jgi:hypothetical protein
LSLSEDWARDSSHDIEWLEEVRGMRRHTERNDVILLAIELEFGGVVALVAIEDQQPVLALCPGRRMVVEVLDPIQAHGISILHKKANGTFLWVALVVQELDKEEVESWHVLQVVEELPPTWMGCTIACGITSSDVNGTQNFAGTFSLQRQSHTAHFTWPK